MKSEIELAKYVVEIAGFVNEFYTSTTNGTDFRILDIYKHNMKFWKWQEVHGYCIVAHYRCPSKNSSLLFHFIFERD